MAGRSLREAHPIERAVGIEYYVSDVDGIGGRLRRSPEDFRVREIERFDAEPVDADVGDYPHLLLRVTLRAWDTNAFARELSNRLGISRERVDWAGTKDKHAVTTQLFSVHGFDADDVPEIRDAEIEVVGRTGRAIEFGDLAGNEFAVTVADPERPENVGEITRALAAFGTGEDGSEVDIDSDDPITVGVPNLFGQQRFGSRRPITHEVGLAVVRGDWEGAVRAYVVDDHENEPSGTREARRTAADCFDDRDWSGALDALPGRLDFERSMLHHLQGGGSGDPDFRGALESLPSNLQRLFVNAAQSSVFNRILSERLARGLPFDCPVEGDVACFADGDAPGEVVVPDTDRIQRVTGSRVDTMTRHCERGRAFVTAPLVGTETELADGEPGEIEREVLDDVGLESADFDLPDDWASEGTRRAILVRTDLTVDGDEEPTFTFALPKGSYATVLLREYCKVDPVDLG